MNAIKINNYNIFEPIGEQRILQFDKYTDVIVFLYTIFLVTMEDIPDDKKPIHIYKRHKCLQEDIWYIKENGKWYEINGVDHDSNTKNTHILTSEVYFLIIKPILLKCRHAWFNQLPNLKTEADKQKHALYSQIICKYETIFDRMHPKVPRSIVDFIVT